MSGDATVRRPAIRAHDILASETTKILTHPATVLALGLALVANTLFAIVAAGEVVRFGAGDDTAPLSAFASVMFAPVYAFLLLPVHAAAGEYRGGQLRMSLAAVPDRRRLAGCKLVATAGVVVLAALVALLPARLVLGVHDGLHAPELLVDIGRWTAVYFLMSLVAFGLAAVLRSTVAPLAILAVAAIFVDAGFLQWPQGVRFLPGQAAMSMLGTPAFDVTALPPVVAALVLAAWAAVATLGYAITLIRRDA